MFKFIIPMILLILTGCIPDKPPLSSTVKIEKPTMHYNEPPKQSLDVVEWDFPRTTNQLRIANNKKCIAAVKSMSLDPNGVFDPSDLEHLKDYCKVPAIDEGSNLYIGMSEANFRSLANNFKLLMMREKQWQRLLLEINKQFKLMNPSDTSKDVKKTTTPIEVPTKEDK